MARHQVFYEVNGVTEFPGFDNGGERTADRVCTASLEHFVQGTTPATTTPLSWHTPCAGLSVAVEDTRSRDSSPASTPRIGDAVAPCCTIVHRHRASLMSPENLGEVFSQVPCELDDDGRLPSPWNAKLLVMKLARGSRGSSDDENRLDSSRSSSIISPRMRQRKRDVRLRGMVDDAMERLERGETMATAAVQFVADAEMCSPRSDDASTVMPDVEAAARAHFARVRVCLDYLASEARIARRAAERERRINAKLRREKRLIIAMALSSSKGNGAVKAIEAAASAAEPSEKKAPKLWESWEEAFWVGAATGAVIGTTAYWLLRRYSRQLRREFF